MIADFIKKNETLHALVEIWIFDITKFLQSCTVTKQSVNIDIAWSTNI